MNSIALLSLPRNEREAYYLNRAFDFAERACGAGLLKRHPEIRQRALANLRARQRARRAAELELAVEETNS